MVLEDGLANTNLQKCFFSISSDLKNHLMTEHENKGEINVSAGKSFYTSDYRVTEHHFQQSSKFPPTLISFGTDLFLAMMMRDNWGFWHFWAFGAGTDKDLATFTQKIRITGGTGTEKSFLFTGPVVSIFKPVNDVVSHHDGLVLTDKALKNVLNKANLFTFEVVIAKK